MPRDDRVLVLGAAGMLGGYIVQVLLDRGFLVSPSTREDFDVQRDPWGLFPWRDYDVVVNALGAIPQKNPDVKTLYRVNAEFPRSASSLCRRWIQVSTDCVFSGTLGLYSIDDEPDPVDDYGKSKLQGEAGVVVRGSFVGEGGPQSLLEVVRSRSSMPGYIDHWWNGVSCLTMAEVIASLVDRDAPSGLFHIAGWYRVSKHDLCQLIADVYDHPIELTPHKAGFVDRTLLPNLPVKKPLRQQLEEQRGAKRWRQ